MPDGPPPTSIVFDSLPSGDTRVTLLSPLLATHTNPDEYVTPSGLPPTGIGEPVTCGPEAGGEDELVSPPVGADELSLLPLVTTTAATAAATAATITRATIQPRRFGRLALGAVAGGGGPGTRDCGCGWGSGAVASRDAPMGSLGSAAVAAGSVGVGSAAVAGWGRAMS